MMKGVMRRYSTLLAAFAVIAACVATIAATAAALSTLGSTGTPSSAFARQGLWTMLLAGALSLGLAVAYLLLGPLRRLGADDEERLQWRQRAEAALHALPDGVLLIDADFVIRDPVSPAVSQLLRYRLWPGMDLIEVLRPMLPADTLEATRAYLRRLFGESGRERRAATRNPLAEVEIAGPPSRQRQLGFRFERIERDGAVEHLLVMVSDIGEKLGLNRELAGARSRLRTQLEGLVRVFARDGAQIRAGLDHAEVALERMRARLPRLANPGEREATCGLLLADANRLKRDAGEIDLDLIETPAHCFEMDLTEIIERGGFEREDALRLGTHLEHLSERIATMRALLACVDQRVSTAQAAKAAADTQEGAAAFVARMQAGRPTASDRAEPVPAESPSLSPPPRPASPLQSESESEPEPATQAHRPASQASPQREPSLQRELSSRPPPPTPRQPQASQPESQMPSGLSPKSISPIPTAPVVRTASPPPEPVIAAETVRSLALPAAPTGALSAASEPAPASSPAATAAPTPAPKPASTPAHMPAPARHAPSAMPAASAHVAPMPAAPAAPAAAVMATASMPERNAVATRESTGTPKIPTPTPTPTPTSTSTSAPTAAPTSTPTPTPTRDPSPQPQPTDLAADPRAALTRPAQPASPIASVHRPMPGPGHESDDPFAPLPLLALSGDNAAGLPPAKAAFVDWAAHARRLGGPQGKAVRVEAELDAFEQLPVATLAILREVGLELVGNAVIHGIEPMSMRRRIGKDPVGVVRLTLDRDPHGAWRFCVRDDGGGIHLVRLRAALLRDGRHRMQEVAQMSEREILLTIFEPGVSTATPGEGIGGRGLGLPAILEQLAGIDATMALASVPGRSSEFRITLARP